MIIYAHPEIKTWRPCAGVAYPPPFPDENELKTATLHDIIFKFPSTLIFVLMHRRGEVRSLKKFRDARFAKALHRNKSKFVGLPLSVIGFVDIPYGPLHAVKDWWLAD
jgi:hypothetical protein